MKRRQDVQVKRIGERIARGVAASRAGRTGRNSRYLFSGLLKCSECGSNYVMVDTRAYACSGYINGRICSNGRYVRRDKLETALLADIQAGLLEPGVVAEIELRVRRALRSRRKDDSAQRLAKLGVEIDHLVAAIGDGMISPAIRQRLQTAEAEFERMTSAPKPASIESLLPRLPELIRAQARNIAQLAEREPVRARAVVQQALEAEAITIRPAEAGRNVIAEYGLVPVQLATGTMPESVVAGARFGTFLPRIRLVNPASKPTA